MYQNLMIRKITRQEIIFYKKYNLMRILTLFCNADYWGISQLHGTLIRQGTYCVVGSDQPMAKEYEIVKDGKFF